MQCLHCNFRRVAFIRKMSEYKLFGIITDKGGKIISKHIFDSFVAGQKNWTNRQKAIKESME